MTVAAGAICDFKLHDQKPKAWATALLKGLCPKCKGKIRCISLHDFFEIDSMSVHYQCQECGLVYDWPHSYIASDPKTGRCVIPISTLKKLPRWFTPKYVCRVEDWIDRGYRDERGRFSGRPR